MRVEPLTRAHIDALILQPHQDLWRGKLSDEQVAALAQLGGWTALTDGEVLGCAGILDKGEGRAEAWALLSARSGVAMSAITRAVARALDAHPARRIEMVTACSFAPAARWAKMLGFRFEGQMSAWCADGSDAYLWARVR